MSDCGCRLVSHPERYGGAPVIDRRECKVAELEATISRFGGWLDINSGRGRQFTLADVIGAWDEARDPGCHGGKFIPRQEIANA